MKPASPTWWPSGGIRVDNYFHTQAAFSPVEAALGALRAMGLRDEQAVHAYRGLVSYARGFALAEIAGFTLEDPPGARRGSSPNELDPETFPHIFELAPHLARLDPDAAFAFEWSACGRPREGLGHGTRADVRRGGVIAGTVLR